MNQKLAYELGVKACKDGKPCIPTEDKYFYEKCSEKHSVENGLTWLNMWEKGWIKAFKEQPKEVVYAYIYKENGYYSIGLKISKGMIPDFIIATKNAPKTTITDRDDRLILNTMYGFVDRCPNQDYLNNELLPKLIPMQQNECTINLEILGLNSDENILELKEYFFEEFSFDIVKYVANPEQAI
ncbi:hypothetical protein [Vallitalea guaymasensis]|uniref:hypothetical protein n=1 Tax=Vallitalea guaymasensis TaxID=1185412 RepID=UPI000DE30F11|nr:hypothetical protein [Vallitalea guaymasensis]